MKNKEIRVGCNTIIVKNGKILLGKRGSGYGQGTWGFPGGHLELDEDLIDGAEREIKEELGLTDQKLEFLSITEGVRDEAHYIQVNFIIKDFKGEVKLMEPDRCEEWRFFEIDNLPENIYPPHQNIIKAYLQNVVYLR